MISDLAQLILRRSMNETTVFDDYDCTLLKGCDATKHFDGCLHLQPKNVTAEEVENLVEQWRADAKSYPNTEVGLYAAAAVAACAIELERILT